jgi:predicted small lipoprotein YifL
MPFRSEMLLLTGLALAGCGLSNGPGSLFVDPGRYSAYHCKDLATQWKTLLKREKDLRALMDKASEGGGGVIIGALAYRSDYESVLTEKKLLQREAAEKNCQLVATYESDQGIH